MARLLFSGLGALELLVAGVLVYFGLQMPDREELQRDFAGASQVTDRAADQVRLLRRQVRGLRRVEFQQLADRLRAETESVSALLKSQPVDFDTLGTVRDALSDVARGLRGLSGVLDPEGVGKLGVALGETATF